MKVMSVQLYTIVRREITRFCRIWIQSLLPSVISTALYFVIFGSLIGERIGPMKGVEYIDYILPGLIMMAIITNAYGNVVASFYISRFQRNIEELLVSPTSSNVILVGYLLGGVTRGLVVGVLVTLVSMCFTSLPLLHPVWTVVIATLVAWLFSILGLINAIFAKNFDGINIVPTFVLTPLTYLGGVFYSVDLLPGFWEKVTHINPIFYMINAFRFAMLGQSDVELSVALMVIGGLIVLLYTIAFQLLKRGVGIRT